MIATEEVMRIIFRFVPLYFDPAIYGMNADWAKYSSNGTAQYYLLINITNMVLPFPFYGAAVYSLLRRQDKQLIWYELSHLHD